MEELKRKERNIKRITTGVIALYLIGAALLLAWLFGCFTQKEEKVSEAVFEEDASMLVDTDMIGSDIRLLQEIHGIEDSVTYRYSIQTVCPSWGYDDRYVTKEPLEWVNDTTSAVETYATNITIRYEGTLYAQGQHYWVPLLEVSSNDGTLEDLETELMDQAYQAYVTDKGTIDTFSSIEQFMGVLLIALVFGFICWLRITLLRTVKRELAEKEQEEDTKETASDKVCYTEAEKEGKEAESCTKNESEIS